MFFYNSLLTACTVAISGLVSASPVARQAQCNPNFEGAGVSIVIGQSNIKAAPPVAGTLLAVAGGDGPVNQTAEWHVEQTGAFPPTYIIKEISHNDLVVDINPDGLLILEEINSSKPTQIWEIACNQCLPGASSTPGGGDFASGCYIISPQSGSCVHLEPAGAVEVNFGVGECGNSGYQHFDFWTATA
ncbi:hypothetical protein FB451DRAFT_1553060 [Mycena latifolia]|nr:hypothetical protein FB451DRAFT_1553060 [Mycena latifolia]